jgi:hypothetical protein
MRARHLRLLSITEKLDTTPADLKYTKEDEPSILIRKNLRRVNLVSCRDNGAIGKTILD